MLVTTTGIMIFPPILVKCVQAAGLGLNTVSGEDDTAVVRGFIISRLHFNIVGLGFTVLPRIIIIIYAFISYSTVVQSPPYLDFCRCHYCIQYSTVVQCDII